MTVRRMTLQDLEMVLGWAAAEGWNPGFDDAAAFHATDPGGFLLKQVGDRPAAAISVVNHDADFAFLGLYIAAPAFRGQGYGLEVWQAGLAHAGGRCVGLDGVPDQQANYARSGFQRTGRTVRYRSPAPAAPTAPATAITAPADRGALIGADMLATGMARRAFATAWFTDTATRKTLCLSATDPAQDFATYRKCREGVKIGPFHAQSSAAARALLAAVPAEFGAGAVFIDIPDSAAALTALVTEMGYEPVFETARMYSAAPPKAAPPPYYGGATLELG